MRYLYSDTVEVGGRGRGVCDGARTGSAWLLVAVAIAAIAFVAPVRAQTVVTLVSNTGQFVWNSTYQVGNASGLLATQGFHTGDNSEGYTLSAVDIGLAINLFSGEETLTLHIYSSNSDGTANALLYTLSPPATPGSAISTGIVDFTAPVGSTLNPDTDYHVVVQGSGDVSDDAGLGQTGSNEETGRPNWTIEDFSRHNGDKNVARHSFRIRIKGTVVSAANTAPTAAAGAVTMNEDTAYTFPAANFNFSDTDNSDVLEHVKITGLPSAGALSVDGTTIVSGDLPKAVSKADIDAGKLIYTSAPNASGTASFNFKVNDGDDDSANAYVMTVTVTAVNDAPTTLGIVVTTLEDTPYTFAAANFEFSDADPGDALESVKITVLPSAGALSVDGAPIVSGDLPKAVSKADIDAGKLTYAPAANATGDATFSFKVNDGDDDSQEVSTIIRITAVNDAPTVATVIPDRTATVGAPFSYQFPANAFRDVDGDALVYAAAQPDNSALPAWLTFADASCTFSGTPMAAAAGMVSVKVTASDGNGESVSDTFVITVNMAPNTAPTAAAGAVTTNEDTAYTFSAGDFNFSDADPGDALESVKITVLPSAGALSVDGAPIVSSDLPKAVTKADIDAGKLTYAPAANATGAAPFNFKVNDGDDDSANAYVMTVTITTPNTAPTAAAGAVTTNEDTAYTFTAANFNFSDTDNSDVLENVKITGLPSTGTLRVDGTTIVSGDLPKAVSKDDIDAGKLTYAPAANASGTTTFSFKVNDGDDDSANAYVMTVTITAVNDAPTVATTIPVQSATVDTLFSYQFPANTFADTDNDPLTYAAAQPDNSALPAWLSFDDATRTFSGTPQAADEGMVSVKVTASDGAGGSVSDEFDITVGTPPPPPTSTIADAPENLQAFAGNAQVILSWNAPSNDGGADITGYAYRYKESGADFTAYTDIPESGPGEANARSYTVTGLTNELEYVFHVHAVNENGGGLPEEATVTLPAVTSAESEELPTEAALWGNYPNPFNPETTIRYALPQTGNVRLAVYDLLGHEVAVLVDEPKPAGHHAARFDAGDLPSGAYVYQLEAQEKIVVRIMMLVK